MTAEKKPLINHEVIGLHPGVREMDVSIIIVNWNTRDLLRNCLSSIVTASSVHQIETIVVDNNSADGSREMVAAEFPKVKLFNSGANLGFAKANNIGLVHATAPLVLYLNPDTELRPDSLKQMMECLRANPAVGALGCKIRNASGTLQQLGLQWFPSPITEILRLMGASERSLSRFPGIFPYHEPQLSGFVKKLYGACLLVRRTVLDQVGAFDERFFMYCEDVDLCHRISKAGWRLYYLAEAEILHLGASSSAHAVSGFSVLMMCQSKSQLMRKYFGLVGSAGFRGVLAVGAPCRLIGLWIAKTPLFAPFHISKTYLDGGIFKYSTMTKWAYGFEKPRVKD